MTTPYRVKHTMAAYEVIGPDGEMVDRYAFDPADFHGSRRAAWREANEDADLRNLEARAAVLDSQAALAELRAA